MRQVTGGSRVRWSWAILVVAVLVGLGFWAARGVWKSHAREHLADELVKQARFGNVEGVRKALDAGADPDTIVPGGDLVFGSPRRTVLHEAAMSGHEGHCEIVKLLLDHGSNANARDRSDNTPLHCLLWQSQLPHQIETAEALLAHGADPNAANNEGETPLHRAAREFYYRDVNFELAAMLLARGADINARDERGRTPLDMTEWYEPGVKFCREHGGMAGTGLRARP